VRYHAHASHYRLQGLACRSALESEDVISIIPMKGNTDGIPYTLRVQLIEADRLCNPMFRPNTQFFTGGAEMTEKARPSPTTS
jgi:hypothetical protein